MFQNGNQRDKLRRNNTSMRCRNHGRLEEDTTAKKNLHVERNTQPGMISSKDDTEPVLNRLKCKKNSSTHNNIEHHDVSGRLPKPNNSKGVHKIAPWLVVENDGRSASRYDNSDSMNGKKINNGIEVVPSSQRYCNTTSQTKDPLEKQNKTPRRSLFGRRRRASSTKYVESSSHPLYRTFPGSTSGDFNSIEIQPVVSGNTVNIQKSIGVQTKESSDSSANKEENSRHCRKINNGNDFPNRQRCENNLTGPVIMRVSSEIPSKDSVASNITRNDMSKERELGDRCFLGNERTSMKCGEAGLPTPRRRNSRSPSPSRVRGQLKSKRSIAAPKGKLGHFPSVTEDFDREFLMGLEMQRDLDRMSLKCGATGSDVNGSSNFGTKRRPPRENRNGFSFLPSSMSCLSHNANAYIPNSENEQSRIFIDKEEGVSSLTVSDPKANTFCNGVSSALLLDIKEDDPLWKFYDDMRPTRPSSNTEKRDGIGCAEERDPFRKSPRNPVLFESKRDETHVLATRDDPKYHSNSFSNDKAKIMMYENENISGVDNLKESISRYETLMDYPDQSKYGKGESRLNKEALLDQMRHAVEKASAQLDFSEKVRILDSEERYRVPTMETEYSDESSYESGYARRMKNLLPQHQKVNTTQDDSTNNSFMASTGIKRDKYDFEVHV